MGKQDNRSIPAAGLRVMWLRRSAHLSGMSLAIYPAFASSVSRLRQSAG